MFSTHEDPSGAALSLSDPGYASTASSAISLATVKDSDSVGLEHQLVQPSGHQVIINATSLLKRFATTLDVGCFPAGMRKNIQKWQKKVAEIAEGSAFKIRLKTYKRLKNFKQMIVDFDESTEGEYRRALNELSVLPAELELFIKVCDRIGLKKLSEPKIRPGSVEPLFCFPKTLLYRKSDEFGEAVMRSFPLVPALTPETSPLNSDYFKKIFRATSCVECSPKKTLFSKSLALNIEVELMVNPFLRDSALTYLNAVLVKKSKSPLKLKQPLTSVQVKPFEQIQKAICDLEQEVKRLTSGQGTILGDFVPTAAAETGIPVFRRPDGQLLAFFWHGSGMERADAIGETSLSLDFSVVSAYGQGLYLTPQVCTATKYAYKGERAKDLTTGCLILSAVFLGNYPYIMNAPLVRGGKIDKKATATFVIPGVTATTDNDIIVIIPHEAQIVPLLKFHYVSNYDRAAEDLTSNCIIS